MLIALQERMKNAPARGFNRQGWKSTGPVTQNNGQGVAVGPRVSCHAACPEWSESLSRTLDAQAAWAGVSSG